MQCDKNMQLVKAIETFPCLYNFNVWDYIRNKDVTEAAWNEVAKQTQLSVSECKEKWKNLRYGLLRSLRLNPDGTVKKKYYLHDEMEFVIPFIKSSKHETVVQTMEETQEETNEQELEHSPVHLHYQELEISEPPKKKSKSNDMMNVKKSQQNITQNYNLYDDSRKMFLLSLLPEINTLSEPQMRVFRRKVLSLIDEISDVQTQYDMCLLEWQKDPISQDSGGSSQDDNIIIKKEP